MRMYLSYIVDMLFKVVCFMSILTFGYSVAKTSRPIIGIVAQELYIKAQREYPQYSSFIAASYVKAVESSGAQVVPIPVNKSESYYRHLLNSINGVVFPGGKAKLAPEHPYFDTVSKIYKIAKQLNDDKIIFPILAVCLGYEFMITIANNNTNILHRCDIFDENLPLKIIIPYRQTNLFSTLTQDQYNLLTKENVTFNWHFWCASTNDFNREPLLHDNWIITSLSTSFENAEFIASVEHKNYPFFGIQFHPEKVGFEWAKTKHYNHSEGSLIANRFFYDRLVHFASENDQKFNDTLVEYKSLIYNYPVTYTQEKLKTYTQVYFDPCENYTTVSRAVNVRNSFLMFLLPYLLIFIGSKLH